MNAVDSLKAAWKKERSALAAFLGYLVIVDREQLYLVEAYSCLLRFLREELGLSKSSALKRICAARLIARFPELLEKVEAGALHLTSLVMLSRHLTEENHRELSALAQNRSEAELERELAKRFPQEAKKLSKLQWQNEREATLHLSVPASLIEKLERLKELRSKAHPDGNLAALLEEALDCYLDRIDPLRRKITTRKTPVTVVHPRRIRRRIHTEVMQRDDARCTFTSADGRRCNERAFLEIDHKIAWAHGGSSLDPSNLRLLCSGHNRYLARKTFGHKVPSRPPPGA